MAGKIMFQLVQKTSFQGVTAAVRRVVVPCHSGKTAAGTGIPASNPKAVLGVQWDIIHGKTGAGGADIGAPSAVIAATGQFFPYLLCNRFFLQLAAGVGHLDISGELATGLEKELIPFFPVFLFHWTKKIAPSVKEVSPFSSSGSHIIAISEINKLEIIAIFQVGAAACSFTKAIAKGSVAAQGDNQGMVATVVVSGVS